MVVFAGKLMSHSEYNELKWLHGDYVRKGMTSHRCVCIAMCNSIILFTEK